MLILQAIRLQTLMTLVDLNSFPFFSANAWFAGAGGRGGVQVQVPDAIHVRLAGENVFKSVHVAFGSEPDIFLCLLWHSSSLTAQ